MIGWGRLVGSSSHIIGGFDHSADVPGSRGKHMLAFFPFRISYPERLSVPEPHGALIESSEPQPRIDTTAKGCRDDGLIREMGHAYRRPQSLPNVRQACTPRETMSFPTPTYPGVDLDANKGPQMNTVAVAFIVLSSAVLALRLVSRVVTHVSAGMDDWLIGVAAACFHKATDRFTGR